VIYTYLVFVPAVQFLLLHEVRHKNLRNQNLILFGLFLRFLVPVNSLLETRVQPGVFLLVVLPPLPQNGLLGDAKAIESANVDKGGLT